MWSSAPSSPTASPPTAPTADAETAATEPPAGVVPRATNYHFMFIDLRPPPAMPMPPPPPVAPPQPQLLRGTSLYAPEAEDYGRPEDYQTLAELGRGSFAVVRKVVHVASGREYAMKVMEKSKVYTQGLEPWTLAALSFISANAAF